MKCPGPTRSVKNTVSSRFNRIAVTTRKKLISLSVKIFTYIHAKLHCIVASLVGFFRNNTPNANMADHSVGARDESHESEVSQALMFCFDNAFPEKSCFVVDLFPLFRPLYPFLCS